MHQDDFSEKFCGEGVPLWAAQVSPNRTGFPWPWHAPYPVNASGIPSPEDCARVPNWSKLVYVQLSVVAKQIAKQPSIVFARPPSFDFLFSLVAFSHAHVPVHTTDFCWVGPVADTSAITRADTTANVSAAMTLNPHVKVPDHACGRISHAEPLRQRRRTARPLGSVLGGTGQDLAQ